MKYTCAEEQFKIAVEALFPNYISDFTNPYWLDAHMLMVGSYRISYWNPYLEEYRMIFDSIDDNAIDCIKYMHDMLKRALIKNIDKKEYDEFNSKFKSNKVEM